MPTEVSEGLAKAVSGHGGAFPAPPGHGRTRSGSEPSKVWRVRWLGTP